MINSADLLMIIHFLWALFMFLGLPLGLWLRSPALRWIHFMGMSLTAAFAITGMYCPLTVWEESLRQSADGNFGFDGGFLAHHLSSILYPQIESWILRTASVLWGVLTVMAMVVIKPKGRRGP